MHKTCDAQGNDGNVGDLHDALRAHHRRRHHHDDGASLLVRKYLQASFF
jgi:hypothetical protein